MENERDAEFTPGTRLGGTGQTGDVGGTSGSRIDRPAVPGGGTGARSTGGFETTSGSTTDGPRGAKEQVKERAREAKERAAEKVEDRISERKYRAAHTLGDVAESLRTAGQQLPADNGMGQYMARAANQVDTLAGFLENRDVAELVDDVEDFARRQPAAFIGGAFTLGVLGARFLKSSRSETPAIGFRDDWSSRETTSRLDEPTQDAVSRPDAPGYEPPDERDLSGDGSSRFR